MDITIIYYTSNTIPQSFFEHTKKHLLIASQDIPIISVSHKPMDLGKNICIGDIGRSHLNIYRQALRGAKEATSRYIAMAEDDVLYSPGYFTCHTPTSGVFAYNENLWNMYTWVKPPVFSYKGRINLHSLICERELFIEAMTERFAKWNDESTFNIGMWAEPGKYEGPRHLNVTQRPTEKFRSPISTIAFSHQSALSFANLGTRKRLGSLLSYEIPHWGTAEEVFNMYTS